jgi:hypothetical protein
MIYRDMYGAIGQHQPNGTTEFGDSACWTGHAIYLHYREKPQPIITYFEIAPGSYVRHPNSDYTNNGFGAVPQCMSRDQYTGVLAGIIGHGDIPAARRAAKNHAKRLFLFSWNTIHNGVDPRTAKWKMPDITGPDILAMELRGLTRFKLFLIPLLCILDIHMLLNTIIFNLFDKDEDQINFAIKHFVQIDHAPTPVSLLSWWLLDKRKLNTLIAHYWSGWRGMPEMVELYTRRLVWRT